MKFIELTVHTTTEASEIIADIMWNYTNYGVTICDVNDIIALQKSKDTMYWDYMDDDLTAAQPKDVLVKCYIAEDIAEKTVGEIMRDVAEAKEMSGGALPFGTLEDTKREVDGDDWIDVWKKHFRPIRLGRIVVVPEWIDYTPEADEKIVLLDSNMAFGTGEHETTSMCVELMQEYVTPDSVCIDVGCGSGILGISAVKLGAKKAYLTDIDYVAVSSATHNSELNGTPVKTRFDVALRCGETVTGLVTAAALVRPTGITGMQVKSLKKKMKDKAFAAGVNRDIIRTCPDMGLTLEDFLQTAIDAMTKDAAALGLLKE